MGTILLLAVAVAFAGPVPAPLHCPPGVDRPLMATANAGVAAYEARDRAGVHHAFEEVHAAFACSPQLLTPPEALALHRLFALDAFLAGQNEEATGELAALRALDPAATLPPQIAPQGHPLQAAFAAASAVPTAAQPWIAPAPLTLVVDGQPKGAVPQARPSLAQAIDEKGRVVWAAALPAGAPRPDLLVEPAPAAKALPRGRLVAAGTCAFTAGLLYTAAWAEQRTFRAANPDPMMATADRDRFEGELATIAAANHRLVLGAGLSGAAAVGLGASALWTIRH